MQMNEFSDIVIASQVSINSVYRNEENPIF